MEQLQKRFRVLKNGNVLEIHGTLGDTANFNILNEMIGDHNIFDCSGILSTSWLGLTTFNRYLSDISGKVELTRVPVRVYRSLRLMPAFGDKYKIKSFEIEVMDPQNPMDQPTTRWIEVKELEQLARKNAGGFTHIAPTEEVVGSVYHLLTSMLKFGSEPPETYQFVWAKANSTQYWFWHNYLSFVNTMNCLAVDLIVAVQNGLTHLLRNIRNRIGNAEAGVAWIHPELNLGTADTVGQFIDWMDKSCSDLKDAIERLQFKFEAIVRQIQSIANNQQLTGPEIFFQQVNAAAAIIKEFQSITDRIEIIGERTGKNILGLKIAGTIRAVLAKVEMKDVTTEILSKVRDSFEIMDPMSEGSWPDTRDVIDQELEEINTDVGQCVVIIQGFDLLRQVLEHRMFEATIISTEIPKLEQGKVEWQDVRSKMEKQVSRTMVTDQEKFSNSFFLTHVQVSKNSPSPGDVFLF